MPTFNKTEQEVVILSAVIQLINEMVNFDMFIKRDSFENSNVAFQTSAHARLFNIWLCDFLSSPVPMRKTMPFDLTRAPNEGPNSMRSYLFYLKEICKNPQLGNAPTPLMAAVENFSNWLDGETVIENVWLPSIELELNMRVKRVDALKITANLAKHNFTRLEYNVKKIQTLLIKNGHQKSLEDCYSVLPEFREWFFDHAFIYQSTHITEFLNNIRWAIQDYLHTEFTRAYIPIYNSGLKAHYYKFDVHSEIKGQLTKAMYWDLMNSVLTKPIVPRFNASPHFKTELR